MTEGHNLIFIYLFIYLTSSNTKQHTIHHNDTRYIHKDKVLRQMAGTPQQ